MCCIYVTCFLSHVLRWITFIRRSPPDEKHNSLILYHDVFLHVCLRHPDKQHHRLPPATVTLALGNRSSSSTTSLSSSSSSAPSFHNSTVNSSSISDPTTSTAASVAAAAAFQGLHASYQLLLSAQPVELDAAVALSGSGALLISQEQLGEAAALGWPAATLTCL